MNAVSALDPDASDHRTWLVEARAALAEGGLGLDDFGHITRGGKLTSLMLDPLLGDRAVYVCEIGAGGTRYWLGSPSQVLGVVYWLLSYER